MAPLDHLVVLSRALTRVPSSYVQKSLFPWDISAHRLSMRSSLVPSFLFFAFYSSSALSFSVSVGSSPTQCGPLSVTWTGGQAPFQIMLIPVYNIPRNISVPSTAFNQNKGTYQISSIPFLQGSQFLLTMSDATGFATGGTSELLTVGAPVGSASCNTTNPYLPFSFNLPSSLQQCGPYVFNGYDGAILPITIAGLIPSGDSFLIHPPVSSGTSFTWTADVAAGNTVLFTMTDAQGNSGGTSYIEIVALSNTASCLGASSPSSTLSSIPSSTSSPAPSAPAPTHTSGVSTGTIIGVAIGVVLAITAIVALAVFYLKRQRYRRTPYGVAPARKSRRPPSVDLDPGIDNFPHPPIYPFPYQADSATRLAPPVISSSLATPSSYQDSPSAEPSVHASEAPHSLRHLRQNSSSDTTTAFGDIAGSSMSSGGRRKAAMAGVSNYQPLTRFILHTDAEDHFSEAAPQVVELPPQYTERRAPGSGPAGERPTSSATGVSSTNGQRVDELVLRPPV